MMRSYWVFAAFILICTTASTDGFAAPAEGIISFPENCSRPGQANPSVAPIADLGTVREHEEVSKNRIVIVHDDNNISLMSLGTGAEIRSLYSADNDGHKIVRESPDRRYEIWADRFGHADLWDTWSGKRLTQNGSLPARKTDSFDAGVLYNDVVFSPDGKRVALRTAHSGVQIFDTRDGRLVTEQMFPVAIDNIRFAPDGKNLIATALSGKIIGAQRKIARGGYTVLNAANGKIIENVFGALEASDTPLFEINASGTRILRSGIGSWTLTEAGTGRLLLGGKTGARPEFARDGMFVIIRDVDAARIADARTGKVLASITNLSITRPLPIDSDLQFSPDNKVVVAREIDGRASLVRLTDGQAIASLGQFRRPDDFGYTPEDLPGLGELIFPTGREFAFSANGSHLTSLDRSGNIAVWDTRSGQRTLVVNVGEGGNYFTSSSGRRLVTIPNKGQAVLWDLQTAKEIATLGPFDLSSGGMEFSGSERLLYVGNGQSRTLWDTAHGRRLIDFVSRPTDLSGSEYMQFERDKFAIIPTGELWDISRLEPIAMLGSGGAGAFAHSGNNEWLVYTGSGDVLDIWDTRNGQRLLTCTGRILGDPEQIPEGTRMITVDTLNHGTLWRIGTQ